MTDWQFYFYASCAAIALFCCLSRLKMAATTGKKRAILLASIRFIALLITYYLIWQIFWDKNLQQEKVSPIDATTKSIVALVDNSKSMDHKTASGDTRKELGQQVLDSLKAAVSQANQDLHVDTVLFSKNLYEADQTALANPNFSEINQAILKTVQRQDVNSLLLISDGAATDQPLTALTQKWINNRALKTYSTLTDFSASKLFDFMLKAVDFDPVTAQKIPFKAIVQGSTNKDVNLNFEINGKLIESFKANISKSTDLYFTIPENLASGWHKYTIYCDPIEGDLSLKNNIIKGVFKRADKSKILYLTGRPRREDISIIRFLKKKYPDRLQHLSIYNPDFQKISSKDVKFLIAGDVPFSALPNDYLVQHRRGNLGILLLATESTATWGQEMDSNFRLSGTINFDQVGDTGKLKAENNLWDNFSDALNLKARNVYKFDGDNFTHLLAVTNKSKLSPFLVMSHKNNLSLLLTDLNWKWDLNADTKTRQNFFTLWDGITTNLLNSFLDETPVKLKVQKEETSVKITTSLALPYTIDDLTNLRLTLTNDFVSRDIDDSVKNLDSYEKELLINDKKGIYFIQASGNIQGRQYMSKSIPVDFSELSEEDYQTIASEDFLSNGQFGQETFADFERHEDLIKKIVADLSPVKKFNTRNRYPLKEIVLALIILVLLGSEWFLERKFIRNM